MLFRESHWKPYLYAQTQMHKRKQLQTQMFMIRISHQLQSDARLLASELNQSVADLVRAGLVRMIEDHKLQRPKRTKQMKFDDIDPIRSWGE